MINDNEDVRCSRGPESNPNYKKIRSCLYRGERQREREKQSEWSGEEGGKTRPEEFSKAKERKIIKGQRKGEGETVERAREGERER